MQRMNDPVSVESLLVEIRACCGDQGDQKQYSEIEALKLFCTTFQAERCFSKSHFNHHFTQLLQLLKARCLANDWLVGVVTDLTCHRVLMTIRLLLRDEALQHTFMEGQSPVPLLSKALAHATRLHITMATTEPVAVDILKELTNIFQKISHSPCYHDNVLSGGVHLSLCELLSCSDLATLQCSMCALINLCKRPSTCEAMCSVQTLAHVLLHINSSYDVTSRRLATDLLLLLSQQSLFRSQLQDMDGLSALIRQVHSNSDPHVLHHLVYVIERLTDRQEVREEVRLAGGIPLLLNILSRHDTSQSTDTQTADKVLGLKSAICSLLTQLVLDDTTAQLLVQLNGVYLIAVHILPTGAEVKGDQRLKVNLQKHALRALRYLFSMERNRPVFKKLFPAALFAVFIDVGHYTRDIGSYSQLVHAVNNMIESERDVIRGNIESTNQNRAPIFTIGGYAVLELLGSGAFGSVYKVRKPHSDSFLALKEIRCTHPSLGKTTMERSSALGRLMTEVNMVREQLRHTNVVTYHKCFQEGGHLYIVMQFLDGASLLEHISSLKEKSQKFTETRLWKIFSQFVLALRYIHKEKRIVHRDLSPANLMLGEGDRLTITDFGLAKQKQREVSVMESVVGTMPYWCPELVENEPYNEKADIWAAGCILYQMATLTLPFHATNMLALARKIAEVEYPRIHDESYSPLVSEVVDRCLTANPLQRADSVQLGAMLADVLMSQIDTLSLSNETLEKRLTKEKQRTLKHINKAVHSEQRYQKLLSTTELGNSQSAVRRNLSSSFAGAETGRTGQARLYREDSPADSDVDTLQHSMDSVFLETVVEEGKKVNPLTSRVRSQSAVMSVTSENVSPLATRQKSRTASVTSTLSISPRHVREISDPVTSLLSHLHKLLTITHLPPPTHHTTARRLLLDKYRMSLFDESSSPASLKAELHKLSTGSSDPVISLVDSETGQSRVVMRALRELREACDGVGMCSGGSVLTYELLQAIIESLATESHYYQQD